MFLHTLRNKHCPKLKKISSQSTLFYQSFHQLAPQALTPFNFSMSMAITCVDAHFCESVSKNPYRGKPNEKQGPKAYQEDQRAKEVQRKGICSRIQICCRIQFFGRMASADKDKLGPRPF